MTEPAVTIQAVHYNPGTNNLDANGVYVVHATCPTTGGFPDSSAVGTARGTANYFTNPASGGSAHYVHDAGGMATEEHCVAEADEAWHAPPNQDSVGDEISGQNWYTREQWLSPEVWPAVDASAQRCAEVCTRRGWPIVKLSPADLLAGKSGVCGHVDKTNAFHQSDHTDPGPNFPWDVYIDTARRHAGHNPEGAFMALSDTQQKQLYDAVMAMTAPDPNSKTTMRPGVLARLDARTFQMRGPLDWIRRKLGGK